MDLVQKTYALIVEFITLPITRDPSLVKKIFLVLTKQMGSLQLLGSEMYSHEGLIVETHFVKLQLLADLYLVCKSQGNKN